MKQREEREISVAMAEAAGKEEATPGTLKEKTEESEALENKASPQQSQQSQAKEDSEEELECAVCLQKCVHPVRLPCTHIFCFLCVKGVANQSKRCAMCRQEIPADFLDHPTLLSSIEAEKEEVLPGGYQWFYEGRNGWWRYDERTNSDLEEAFTQGQPTVTLLIAGHNYDINFATMRQSRSNNPGLRRKVKRDVVATVAKGTAGLSDRTLKGQSPPRPPPSRRGRKRKLAKTD